MWGNSRAKELWEKAVEKLNKEDRKEFNFDSTDKRSTLVEILSITKMKREEWETNQWSVKTKDGEKTYLRDMAERLLTNLKKFETIGNLAFQSAPQPASVAWTGFRALLLVHIQP